MAKSADAPQALKPRPPKPPKIDVRVSYTGGRKVLELADKRFVIGGRDLLLDHAAWDALVASEHGPWIARQTQLGLLKVVK